VRTLVAVDGDAVVRHRATYDEDTVGEADAFIRKCETRHLRVYDESGVTLEVLFRDANYVEAVVGARPAEIEPELPPPTDGAA